MMLLIGQNIISYNIALHNYSFFLLVNANLVWSTGLEQIRAEVNSTTRYTGLILETEASLLGLIICHA